MELAKDVKAVIVLSMTSLMLIILDIVSMQANHEWGMVLPAWVHEIEPHLINLLVPVVFALFGFAMLWAWLGERVGLLIIAVVTAFVTLTNLGATYFRLEAALFEASVICAAQLVVNVPLVVYAVKGYRAAGKPVVAAADSEPALPGPSRS